MDFQQSPANGMYDPASFIDPSAIGNSQMNGARPYPMSSIPQKRDSAGTALSRSQTPSQQPQFGFPQQGFAHTPSPTMQNQHFRPGQVAPQRMQSPAQHPNAPQMSPMGFAQPSPMPQGFDPNQSGQFPGVQLSQNLQSRQQETQRRYAMQLQAQAQAQQQHQHQQQHQQQSQMNSLAASNMAAQQRHMQGQMPGAPGQLQGMPQRNMMPNQAQTSQQQLQAFLKNVAAVMAQNGRPFNPQPTVSGRPISLQQLYWAVMKHKGWRYVTQTQSWPRVASMMGIDLRQFPSAAEELRQIYDHNLVLYENVYVQKQQAMKTGQMQGQMAGQMGGMGPQMSPTRPPVPGTPNNPAVNQEYLQQLQRSKAMAAQQRQADAAMQQHQPQQVDPSMQQPPPQPFGQSTPVQHNASIPTMNGQSTPQPDSKAAAAMDQHQRSMSRQLESTPERARSSVGPSATPAREKQVIKEEHGHESPTMMENGKMTYKPTTRMINRWSGLDFDSQGLQHKVEGLIAVKPNMPAVHEMGVIDIRALTMSIRSGLHAETRMALDTFSKLTYEQQITLELEKCEDLVDVLVDFAEDQLEILANDNPEVSDILDLTPYEDVISNCRSEVSALQAHPEVGTKEHDLERTADRLLAITTIFRNLSFHEINHILLTSPSVLTFFSNAIRLVGTRVLLLRTHVNTFDFMKDLITFFSNTSAKVALPTREDAYATLHFLCAFAPAPRPTTPVRFASYDPKIHRYLPSAVDSLAKLLARDDNRTHFKQIFANEATSSPPYDLLTRAFALAIAVVPDRTTGVLHEVGEVRLAEVRHIESKIADARKPYLMQGMLAADILASLAPGPESGVCRSWLEADDGWAASLLKFAMSLCGTDATMMPPQQDHRMQGRNQRPMNPDEMGYQFIVQRALSTLKRLGDKSRGGDVLVKSAQTNGHMKHDDEESDDEDMDIFEFGGSSWKVKADVLPKKETLLSALLTPNLDHRSLRQFCSIGYLDDTR